MSKFIHSEGNFGKYTTTILGNEDTGASLEIAHRGATLLKFNIPYKGSQINIIDGFATPEEMEGSKGARNWIMVPFANRIKNGKYKFDGKEYQMDPVPPRNQVMHGILSNVIYDLHKIESTENSITAIFITKKIRKDVFKGYPFSFDVYVKYKLEEDKLTISITGENVGTEPAPFFSGWHGYFKTGNNGIDHLELTVDAEKIIVVDNNLIPQEGDKAFANIANFPTLDFRKGRHPERRILEDKKLDTGFADLMKHKDGYSRATISDSKNGLTLSVFQRGGVTLVFTGDSLPSRIREAIAIEPMQFMTNSFNRIKEMEGIVVQPGRNTEFTFGVEIIK